MPTLAEKVGIAIPCMKCKPLAAAAAMILDPVLGARYGMWMQYLRPCVNSHVPCAPGTGIIVLLAILVALRRRACEQILEGRRSSSGGPVVQAVELHAAVARLEALAV